MGRFEQLIQEITVSHLNFLFIGPGGSGKTHAAALLAPPTLFLDCEGGLRTVQRLLGEPYNCAAKTITIPRDKPWDFLVSIIDDLKNQTQFRSICLDSITLLSYLFLCQLAAQGDAERRILRNYGMAIDRLKQTVWTLNESKAHVIYIAQEAASTDDQGIVTSIIPNVAGKETFARELPAMVDEVWYFSTSNKYNPITKARETKRVILTAPSGPKLGKDRTGILNVEEEIDFDALRAKLQL